MKKTRWFWITSFFQAGIQNRRSKNSFLASYLQKKNHMIYKLENSLEKACPVEGILAASMEEVSLRPQKSTGEIERENHRLRASLASLEVEISSLKGQLEEYEPLARHAVGILLEEEDSMNKSLEQVPKEIQGLVAKHYVGNRTKEMVDYQYTYFLASQQRRQPGLSYAVLDFKPSDHSSVSTACNCIEPVEPLYLVTADLSRYRGTSEFLIKSLEYGFLKKIYITEARQIEPFMEVFPYRFTSFIHKIFREDWCVRGFISLTFRSIIPITTLAYPERARHSVKIDVFNECRVHQPYPINLPFQYFNGSSFSFWRAVMKTNAGRLTVYGNDYLVMEEKNFKIYYKNTSPHPEFKSHLSEDPVLERHAADFGLWLRVTHYGDSGEHFHDYSPPFTDEEIDEDGDALEEVLDDEAIDNLENALGV